MTCKLEIELNQCDTHAVLNGSYDAHKPCQAWNVRVIYKSGAALLEDLGCIDKLTADVGSYPDTRAYTQGGQAKHGRLIIT